MNVLDENIIAPERARLRIWRIHFRSIGEEVGRIGMKDQNDILPLLHSLKGPTFFTRDHGFYRPVLLHAGYCMVYLDVEVDETAEYIRRFLRYQAFRRQAQRMGKIACVRRSGVSYWQIKQRKEQSLGW